MHFGDSSKLWLMTTIILSERCKRSGTATYIIHNNSDENILVQLSICGGFYREASFSRSLPWVFLMKMLDNRLISRKGGGGGKKSFKKRLY